MKATKKELRGEITALRGKGGVLSNVCFNLSQIGGRLIDKKSLAKLVKEWDAIKRAEPVT